MATGISQLPEVMAGLAALGSQEMSFACIGCLEQINYDKFCLFCTICKAT
jgi:hypothetical protein